MFPKTLYSLVCFASQKYGDTAVISDGEITKTYKEFFSDINTFASRLAFLGLNQKHIAVCGGNSYNWLVSYFAAASVGTVLPLGDDLEWEDITALCKKADCAAVIDCGYTGEITSNSVNVIDSINLYQGESISFEALSADSIAALIPTSGTMGKGRICMLTHKNLCADIYASVSTFDFFKNTVAILPFHHSFGMLGGVFVALYNGVRIAVCPEMHKMYSVISAEKPAFLFAVPAIADGIKAECIRYTNKRISSGIPASEAEAEGYAYASKLLGGECKFIITGGAPLSKETESFFANTSILLCGGYGLTECSPAVSVNPLNKIKQGSVGPAMKGISVRIIEPDESGCGEIAVKGDTVMAGYYNDDESNSVSFADCWLLTGDMGRTDEDGYIYITGRKKNTIILSNGKNVMPEELEEKLCEYENVTEALVYGEGDVIAAKIYSLYPEKCKKEIEAFNMSVPMYKRISHITFTDAPLPRNALKKLIRGKN